MEAIILTKIERPTLHSGIPKKANVEAVIKDLDIVDELREAAGVLIVSYQQSWKACTIGR